MIEPIEAPRPRFPIEDRPCDPRPSTAALALVSAVLIAADGSIDADLNRLQGTWDLVLMEVDGSAVPAGEFQEWNANYKGNKLTRRVGRTVRGRGIVTLEPTRTPKAINTWDQDGRFEDQTVPGIYEIGTDTLRVCFAKPGKRRPTEFTTQQGTGFLYCVYKRRKTADVASP